jgi:hypothetical protein
MRASARSSRPGPLSGLDRPRQYRQTTNVSAAHCQTLVSESSFWKLAKSTECFLTRDEPSSCKEVTIW